MSQSIAFWLIINVSLRSVTDKEKLNSVNLKRFNCENKARTNIGVNSVNFCKCHFKGSYGLKLKTIATLLAVKIHFQSQANVIHQQDYLR